MAFSPDGKTILTGCYDRTARLWDAATGRPLGPPMEHSGPVKSVAFSPDGKTILTGSNDKTARLWDAATGRPIGQPLAHSAAVSGPWRSAPTARRSSPGALTRRRGCGTPPPASRSARPCRIRLRHKTRAAARGFQPGWPVSCSRMIAVRRGCGTPRRRCPTTCRGWPPGSRPPRGWSWMSGAAIRVLDRSAWLERRRRLEQLGGPPPADPAPRLDPILFGGNPAARGDAWKERGLWDQAEAAYAEAIRARPLNRAVWHALARLHVERGHLDRAAATLAEAVRLMPDDLVLRLELSRALLWSGDWAGWRRSNAALLDRFGATSNAMTARSRRLGLRARARRDRRSRVARPAGRGRRPGRSANPTKPYYLSTLGAALYRAGRFDDAIRRLDEAIRLRGGESLPTDWAFLAMAHHRLGHHAEARRWLDRLRDHRAQRGPDRILERAGNPPAPERGRGGDPLRSGVPGRPVRTLTGKSIGIGPPVPQCVRSPLETVDTVPAFAGA